MTIREPTTSSLKTAVRDGRISKRNIGSCRPCSGLVESSSLTPTRRRAGSSPASPILGAAGGTAVRHGDIEGRAQGDWSALGFPPLVFPRSPWTSSTRIPSFRSRVCETKCARSKVACRFDSRITYAASVSSRFARESWVSSRRRTAATTSALLRAPARHTPRRSDTPPKTAAGYMALNHNTSGSENVGTGYGSLFGNTTGYDNTACGTNSMIGNMTGYYNVEIGASAVEGGRG